ncbi:hypothetical protein HYALB_00003944 [Hymenoscyphus albidus]|uniref:L-ornithine N(5)-monooxygenase n=1 Tax=Hymenoscyphus albidus TaxID=595503 RepID=A0A9N9LWH6_9HELO|nr:hypothetical protein HYALB_00003944 [Hymenoscyphus albidus]
MEETNQQHIHDVLIVGAGPCGLALAARIRENTPGALFTESEHQRFHWMKASSTSKLNSKPIRTSRRSNTAPDRLLSGPQVPEGVDIKVLDESGDKWMAAWNERFERLNISHLRSPMFFQIDPKDRDGLLGFAHREERENELREIKGVVGKDLSKHQRKQSLKNGAKSQETSYLDERDRKDMFRPSQALFKEHCWDVARHYGLEDVVEKSRVTSVSYESGSTGEPGIFTVETSTGVKKARVVVFATGPSAPPVLPPSCSFCHERNEGVSHAFEPTALPDCVLPVPILDKIKAGEEITVGVVGGGLTSAQISDAAIKRGVTKVHHIMRGPMKIKHFDMDLSWVGKYKNFHLASFWSADTDEERWEMIKEARNGGSITPEYKKILENLIKAGKVNLYKYTEVIDATWDANSQMWTLITSPPIPDLKVHHIVYATGIPTDFTQIPALKPLLESAPIKSVGGIPCCTNELMWNDDIPFFFTGRLAALRLGPAAPNLDGARQGAERIAGKIAEIFGRRRRDSGYASEAADGERVDMRRLGLGRDNQFEVLAALEDDSS